MTGPSTADDRAALLELLRGSSGEWLMLPAVLAGMREGYTPDMLRRDLLWLQEAGLVSRRYSGRGLWWRRIGEVRAVTLEERTSTHVDQGMAIIRRNAP